MKPITTEASYRQTARLTNGETDIILLSHLLMEEYLKKSMASANFLLASSNKQFRIHDTIMKPITTEASNKRRNRHNSSVAFAIGGT